MESLREKGHEVELVKKLDAKTVESLRAL